MSFWRIEDALYCQVDVFWSHVHPIWHSIQELCHGSRLGYRELPSRNVLVHVITVIVKVHFTTFIAVNRRWTWNTYFFFFGTKIIILSYIVYDIVFDIGYDIEDAPKRRSLYTRYWFEIEENPSIAGTIFNFNALCTLDMYSISKFI
jgi:hypothetical protein